MTAEAGHASSGATDVERAREAAEERAAELAAEMILRWRQGERPLPEEFLARHPELWQHPEAAADLIYEELCLRQEYGAEVPLDQVLGRFPQWRPQLEVLFDCQRVLGPRRVAPQFPTAGDVVGDFLLDQELGRGAHGRVFLAWQQSLGNRPVVLKLIPLEAGEHLSLARLQHTHIVPLYSVEDLSGLGLRALCMPYFGGVTLATLLEALRSRPPAQRTGQDLLMVLDQAAEGLRFARNVNGPSPQLAPARQLLARSSYVQAVCWIGACLADALQYAHERGLLHLDLKPSNVLLAADGQPMLLDFHLAREPVQPDAPGAPWLGGTTGYMSPEQATALRAIQQGQTLAQPVDSRSDIYSLGVVLYEALGGSLTVPGEKPQPLYRVNPQVSPGLTDIVRKCLADDSAERYPDMAALAADLRRHLADLPLAGVRNRSLVERWRKWRRRRPQGIALLGMMLTVLTAAGAVALGAISQWTQQVEQARAALHDGQLQLAKGEWEGARRSFQRGRSMIHGFPWQDELAAELDHALQLAEQVAAKRLLHQSANRIRFVSGSNSFSPEDLRKLETSCRDLWAKRDRIVERLTPAASGLDAAVRDDLLDVALFWAELQQRLAKPGDELAARRQARLVLAQTEALFGPSAVLEEERKHLGEPGAGASAPPPRTAWEHYALSRALLRSGELDRAAHEAEQAVRLEPQGLWPNFYQGLCAYRQGRYADAVAAYSVCIGATSEAAGCFYNRALSFAALGRTEEALRDYDQALQLDPTLADAALNRGLLHYRVRHYLAALLDLERARELGADPALVSFSLALVRLARGEPRAALAELGHAFQHLP
jgi:serine/threonine protein kinase